MRRRLACLLIVLASASCSTKTSLVATPTVALGDRGRAEFAAVPPARQHSEISMLFAADRAVMEQTLTGPRYGFGRSGYLAFGAALVGFVPEVSWDELVKLSTERKRSTQLTLELRVAVEYARLAVPLGDMEVRDGRYQLAPRSAEQLHQGRERLHELLSERLEQTDRKDVYLFVHGFNNTFEDAIFRWAMVWHFMGRVGVPMAYTWPAGKGGLFGYAYDRESGDFTVFHLKKMIVAIASCPDVERLHLIAHSRGCDVVTTALRELNIEIKASGKNTHQELKLKNLVLAAPDLDADVFEQRFGIEDLHLVADRTTVYLHKQDLALELSNWIFGGRNRVGNLTADKFTDDARAKLAHLKNFNMISCDVSGYSSSHDYVFAHPAVLSDLTLLLRDDRAPGAANGRPLDEPWEGIWQITNNYLSPTTQPLAGKQFTE